MRNFWRWCRSSAPNTRAKHSGKRPFSASKRSGGRQLKAPSAHNLRLSNIFSCTRIVIAFNATLGSPKNQLEVSGFCNQYKYALPTSDQDVRQEARGHCLLSIYLCLGGDHHHVRCSVDQNLWCFESRKRGILMQQMCFSGKGFCRACRRRG